ncbi:MAG: PEP-CTERM/exosortase system-associated acyltransferase [Methylococcales bacterium]
MTQMMNLKSHFNEFFYVARINTPELLDQAFKLRYEVYIKDCGYEFHNPYGSDEIEKDSYDEHSYHCLLFHKPTNKPIGYIRLIPYKTNADYLLPVEKFGIDFNQSMVKKLRSSTMGEISRMAIHPSFRRRLSDKRYQFECSENSNGSRFRVNYLPACLVLACGSLMKNNHIEHSVALMENKLAVLIKKYGVVFEKIGNSIQLNGTRTPFLMSGQEIYENLSTDFKDLFNSIDNQINPSHPVS